MTYRSTSAVSVIPHITTSSLIVQSDPISKVGVLEQLERLI